MIVDFESGCWWMVGGVSSWLTSAGLVPTMDTCGQPDWLSHGGLGSLRFGLHRSPLFFPVVVFCVCGT